MPPKRCKSGVPEVCTRVPATAHASWKAGQQCDDDDGVGGAGEKLDDIIVLLGEWLNDELLLLMLADGLNEVLGNPKRNFTSI